METLLQDIRYALRTLRKNPGFAAIVVLTLSLGIGATTAIFSVVYGLVLRQLPYEKADQIVSIWELNANRHRMNFTDPNFEDLREQNHSFEGLAEYRVGLESVAGGSEPTRTMTAAVSHDFFPLMRVQPVLGRGFAAEEQRFGAVPTALVSYEYWRQFLGGAKDLSAVKLKIENRSLSVIGVLPAGFHFPDDSEIWVPRELYERLPSRNAHNWLVIGRLRANTTLRQAHADMAAIARQIKQQYGQDVDMTDVSVLRLQEAMTGEVRPALIMLSGAVAFLLLIACANVANLLLVQASARQRELAIRTAIGAARSRLVRQFLTEACILSLAGGLVGALIARWGLLILVRLAPPNFLLKGDALISLPVLAFTIGISLAVAIGLGFFIAFRATAGGVQQTLTEHGRAQTGAPSHQRLSRVIVTGQLATTLILLTGAGLLGRSLMRVLAIDPGFHAYHIVTIDLALSYANEDPEKIQRIHFLTELFSQLRSIPGVREVGGTGRLPLTEPLSDGTYVVMNPGERPPANMDELGNWFHNQSRTGYANYSPVSEGYFGALGIPLLRGRWFDDRDSIDAPHVAIINQALAIERWPGADPLGRMIEFGNMDGDLRPFTIVGVVGDMREDNLEAPPDPTIYVNYRQRPQATYRFTSVVRTEIDPSVMIAAARRIVRSLDPDVPPRFGTFSQVLSKSLTARRFNLTLVGAFAVSALLLAMAGLYGVMAYVVAQRTGEFGVRMALGASSANILRLILNQGFQTVLAGVAIGIAGALALTRTLRSLLFGLSPNDPVTLIGVTAGLILVALLACYIPARRATKIDPIVALRYE